MPQADLLITMGTLLVVHPFASLIGARRRLLPVTALRAPLSLVPQWRCMHMAVHSGKCTLQIETCPLCSACCARAWLLPPLS